MLFHSTTISILAYLLPLWYFHLPQQQQQQQNAFKLAILYNKNIADAHPNFLLEEAILLFYSNDVSSGFSSLHDDVMT